MGASSPILVAVLAISCAALRAQTQEAPEPVRVRVVDSKQQPIPGAVVWSMPGPVWERRSWIPAELQPWGNNPYELLRRLGTRSVADDSGFVRVLRDTMLAGEHRDLAGVMLIAKDAASPCGLRLDDWRWTIRVRDQAGKPVAGVPIAAKADAPYPSDEFTGMGLGLTDAAGQVVVRAPGSLHVEKCVSRPPKSGGPSAPAFALFEVDGMYLASHAGRLSLADGVSGSVTLTMPPATWIEVRLPEWNGPIGFQAVLTQGGQGSLWDDAVCWRAGDRLLGLVGTGDEGRPIVVTVEMPASKIRTSVAVSHLPREQSIPIQLELDIGDIVVRARLHDASGRAAARAVIEATPHSESLRTTYAQADQAGVFALVFRPGLPAGTELKLRVDASPELGLLDAVAHLKLDELLAGDRRDYGILTLIAK